MTDEKIKKFLLLEMTKESRKITEFKTKEYVLKHMKRMSKLLLISLYICFVVAIMYYTYYKIDDLRLRVIRIVWIGMAAVVPAFIYWLWKILHKGSD